MNLNVFVFAVFLACTASASATEQDQARVVEFVGFRKATAVILSDDTGYTVTAEMTPVKVFDDASNTAVNRRLLMGIALRGLVNLLSDEPVTLTVTAATPGKITMAEDRCQLTIRIPIDGIEVQPLDESPDTPSRNSSGNDTVRDGAPLLASGPLGVGPDLLARKQEYATLVGELADVWKGEVDVLQEAAMDGVEVHLVTGATIANRVSDNFLALSAEIQRDLMLLSFERQELLEQMRSQEQRLIETIHSAAGDAETKGD